MRVAKQYDKNTFYCFSPPVMIITFAIEIGLALYTLWRYKLTTITRLAALLLMTLATFQLAEYMVCQGFGGDPIIWSRLGFVAITLLPATGLHLLFAVSKLRQRWLSLSGYVTAAVFVAFFTLLPNSIVGDQCMGNYVIFQVGHHVGSLYGLYYYGLLIASLAIGWRQLHKKHDKKTKQAIGALMMGYTIFLIPTTAAVLAKPEVLTAIPSIMCGFAVLLALVLGLLVLPSTAQRKKK